MRSLTGGKKNGVTRGRKISKRKLKPVRLRSSKKRFVKKASIPALQVYSEGSGTFSWESRLLWFWWLNSWCCGNCLHSFFVYTAYQFHKVLMLPASSSSSPSTWSCRNLLLWRTILLCIHTWAGQCKRGLSGTKTRNGKHCLNGGKI